MPLGLSAIPIGEQGGVVAPQLASLSLGGDKAREIAACGDRAQCGDRRRIPVAMSEDPVSESVGDAEQRWAIERAELPLDAEVCGEIAIGEERVFRGVGREQPWALVELLGRLI